MRILLTNDDGISAPGLQALRHAVEGMGEIHVVAPATVQSAMSHGVTFGTPMAVRRVSVPASPAGPAFEGTSVAGRPADCVKLAIAHLVPAPIDLVVSGINAGANIGINVIYSGTVAAAMEAGFLGVPSIAMSLHLGDSSLTRWDAASRHARAVLKRLMAGPLEKHTVLNVNIPILDRGVEPGPMKVVPISISPIVDRYQCDEETEGGPHYTAAGHLEFHYTPPESDVEALFQRFITVTPLHYDLTLRSRLARWTEHVAE
ncbi:MAG: 5'/3'-nucleotidase SurE [Planctomycetota bacterium]|nr:5'/3'-nucleotidase SurE [Planctomycetota bacterium]